MAEKSLASALIKGKCPRCRTGEMFSYPATHLTQFNKMNEFCPHCGVRLEPEPGFYQGAMYVGYAFSVTAIVMIGFLVYLLFDNPADWVYITAVIVGIMLLVPLNYRYSRIVYLHAFGGIKYDRGRSM